VEAAAYKKKPIASIESLASTLSISQAQLIYVADNAERYYSISKKSTLKPDGTYRITYRVAYPLKIIQERIKTQIFDAVIFPSYLQAARDENNPRGYIANAHSHVGQTILLKEDIRKFFPSIRPIYVHKMWKYLFHFPEEVANILTKLTTYQDGVPQGAKTSAAISNLIFWDKEPYLIVRLQERGFVYTRYIDDISISADRNVAKIELQWAISQIFTMLSTKQVQPNRKKHSLQTKSKRMSVHRLCLNSGEPTIGKKKQSQIRAAVKQLEGMVVNESNIDEYITRFRSVRGQVATFARTQPQKAEKYLDRLLLINPI